MLCYKDKTFCASPNCENECGRKMKDEEHYQADSLEIPIAWGYFCGLPDDAYQSIKNNEAPE